MIVLDTHIWFWWVQDMPQLGPDKVELIESHEGDGVVLSDISLWETATAVQRGRMVLPMPVEDWMALAIAYPGVRVEPITPKIAIEAVGLPGTFHRDPADQIIVATARILDCPLMTADGRILGYEHVRCI